MAIIQARMGSTRFPGKVLADLAGKPLLWHVVNRLKYTKKIDKIVVATSDKKTDDPIEKFCDDANIACFRGSETDVLDRFYQAAKFYKANTIVRVTADCPLIDPEVVDRVINKYLSSGSDYVSNNLVYTYPDGLDVEVFSFKTLESAWLNAAAQTQREHVTPYIRTSGNFKLINVENQKDLSHLNYRWTVDDVDDLRFVREVYKYLYKKNKIFLMIDVLSLLEAQPEIHMINQKKIRNEGYYISIVMEGEVIEAKRLNLEKSKSYLERAKKTIPSQTQTFSKGPNQFVQGVSPIFLEKGAGSHIWDVDGNEFIDYIAALGPLILGYNYAPVTDAVMKQLKNGSIFSLPHPLEVELAEILVEIIPCAEMVRYGKNGSDATSGAVRLARAYTGREKIACCGYHGWQDWFIGTTTRSRGVPKSTQNLTFPFEYNNIASLEKILDDNREEIAAVIMEPVGVVAPQNDFLNKVKDATHRHGALLIFDEVITGFRLAIGGAQEYYSVVPDLACFGKALANGFPLSAVVGKRNIMELFDEIFFSFTFGGEVLSLAAAKATIGEMINKNVIAHLWGQGQKLKDGYNVIARELDLAGVTECVGLAPHTIMIFKDRPGVPGIILRSLLQQELVKRGVLLLVGNNICYSHSDADIDYTLKAYRSALGVITDAIDSGKPRTFLEGEPAEPVFRKA